MGMRAIPLAVTALDGREAPVAYHARMEVVAEG